MSTSRGFWRQALLYVACYLLWLAFSALALWLFLQLRVNLVEFFIYFRLRSALFPVVHNFGMVLLGILWLVFVIALEDFLRQGLKKNDLWQRAGGILLVLLVMLGLSYGFQAVLFR